MIELIELKNPITLEAVERMERWRARNRIRRFYPDEGPLRRELYPKHLAFFAAGAEHRERLMMAANRVGKTEGVGAYEVTCHLTGIYPAWWTGKRFRKPVKIWAAGDTSKTVREIELTWRKSSVEPAITLRAGAPNSLERHAPP